MGLDLPPSRTILIFCASDVHVDRHYKASTSDEKACHRGKGQSGHFGAEGTDCDAPVSLVNETLRWIEKNVKDNIDFVVWTGDTARHDNDDKIPRTEDEVLHLQRFLTDGFVRVFREDGTEFGNGSPGSLSIPIVPTIGNNDVMPHNIFKPGPNKWTRRLLDIWSELIPETQRHTFADGGWFAAEVIPDRLAVVSLNTMYFFNSNGAVDGCKDKSEPGYEQMEWLRVQLKLFRDRQMKAIFIGHVPPARSGSKENWDETCWQKYNLWVHQYRDVVIGSVYGHMNIDHFMFQDSEEVEIADLEEDEPPLSGSGNFSGVSAQSRADYLTSLREQWCELPSPPADVPFDDLLTSEDPALVESDSPSTQKSKKRKLKKFLGKIGGPWAERYSVSLVSPSVIPGYYPTLRIIEYNITGLEDAPTWADAFGNSSRSDTPLHAGDIDSRSSPVETDMPPEEDIDNKKKKKKKKKPKFTVPDPPSPSAPPGPAYSNQPLTWLGYTQYYANLTTINSQVAKLRGFSAGGSAPAAKDEADKAVHDIFTYEVEYNTRDDKVYKLRDITVRNFFKLAKLIAETDPNKTDAMLREDKKPTPTESAEQVDGGSSSLDDIGPSKKKKKKDKNQIWRTFLTRAFVGFLDIDELDDTE